MIGVLKLWSWLFGSILLRFLTVEFLHFEITCFSSVFFDTSFAFILALEARIIFSPIIKHNRLISTHIKLLLVILAAKCKIAVQICQRSLIFVELSCLMLFIFLLVIDDVVIETWYICSRPLAADLVLFWNNFRFMRRYFISVYKNSIDLIDANFVKLRFLNSSFLVFLNDIWI